jgi:ferric-dicitrate binding protein FerR (iron transport regulator)
MRITPALQASETTGDRSGQDATTPSAAPARNRHRRRVIMRQMLIAAAIAAGLVALWAALLPLAA